MTTVYVVQGGATVDGKEIDYENIPVYRVGDRYLLFLEPNPVGRPEDDFSSVSGVYGSYLLKDGQVYRPLGQNGSWIRDEQRSETELLQFLRSEAQSLPTH